MRQKKRISPIAFRNGTRRPEVFTLQRMVNTAIGSEMVVDGWAGENTERQIKTFQREQGLEPDGVAGANTQDPLVQLAKGVDLNLMRVIQSIICWYETSSTRNSYGDTSLLDDGAGTNYGVLQHNSLGSLIRVLEMGGEKALMARYKSKPKDSLDLDVKAWMGSEEGIRCQNRYFALHVWLQAEGMLAELPAFHESLMTPGNERYFQRAMLLICDSIVQNGALWSPNRKPFWRTITPEEQGSPKYRELYEGHEWDKNLGGRMPYSRLKAEWDKNLAAFGGDKEKTNKITMIQLMGCVHDYEAKLILMAEWRARSSSPKWWKVVQARRLTDATGKGTVNGRYLDLARDYCFAEDHSTWED